MEHIEKATRPYGIDCCLLLLCLLLFSPTCMPLARAFVPMPMFFVVLDSALQLLLSKLLRALLDLAHGDCRY